MNNNRSRNTSNMPKLVASLLAAIQIPDLRNKIFFTIFMLIIFRFVAHVPVPGVDTQALSQAFQQNALLGFLDLFSGGALKNLSIAALGVYPYITASIVIQILTPAIPQLKELSQEGEFGRQKINQITHYIMIPIALLQAWGQLTLLNQAGVFDTLDFGLNFITLTIMTSMVAGTVFLVWIGELISERGLGNGVSLIIFGGIVANLPNMLGQGLYMQNAMGSIIVLVIFTAIIIFTIVLFSEAQRRIPIQYGKTIMRGGQVQRQTGSSILPIKVNSAGMIPLIFAFSIVILPATIAGFFVNPLSDSFGSNLAKSISGFFDPTNL
ncbi:MAG: preprotein translocase subunit SecY, partial [Chloroflexi bacterium]|nr:preprotein translocase subunit SecY [Chloroflexota bacterium]